MRVKTDGSIGKAKTEFKQNADLWQDGTFCRLILDHPKTEYVR